MFPRFHVTTAAIHLLLVIGIVLLVRLQLGRAALPDYLRAAGRMAVIVALALALGWIAWPWAYAHPLVAPFAAMRELGHFGWAGTVLPDLTIKSFVFRVFVAVFGSI